ncbi:TPA: hypothetical protein N0F65_000743 [Lagenidium giganteum]|uniref:Phospholipid-transporting ATPase n=1 Tax=Lagenidium giganteum TaxID=4803 RepID=A0AAV2ZHM6_9STRA|nr:TPA: hypothetical protein N0F65_000743 [Lagenidium giganteum]
MSDPTRGHEAESAMDYVRMEEGHATPAPTPAAPASTTTTTSTATTAGAGAGAGAARAPTSSMIGNASTSASGRSSASTVSSSHLSSERFTRNFHRNQTIEVLPRASNGTASGLRKNRPDSELMRTFTSGDLLSSRQRLLENNECDQPSRTTTTERTRTRTTTQPDSGAPQGANANGRSWRVYYRNLPRTLRFRQNTRTTTRYIDPANAASLRSRLRAKQSHTEGERELYDTMSPVPTARAMTDFDRQMMEADRMDGLSAAAARAAEAGGAGSSQQLGRTSSYYSQDTVAGDRKSKYKTVSINGGAPPVIDGEPATEPEVFVSNEVRTSQYSWWSFVPVFLYLTFQKIANLYFLMIGIFQMIPDVSPTNGVPLQFLPLSIVTIIDAVFAGYEDYKRHVADDQANSAKTQRFNRELREFEEEEWRDVKVGDFLCVKNHETIPVDLLILSVVPADGSRSDGGNTGVCYVETKNLDGETNLKLREAPVATRHMFDQVEEAGDALSGYLESELPNSDINRYSGTLYVEGDPVGVSVSLKNMLLRGSKLRNTSCVYGLVVNTGIDTKIMMSSGDEFPVKLSSIDEMTNNQVCIVVFLLIVMSITGAVADKIWMNNYTLPAEIQNSDLQNRSFIGVFVYYFTTFASMVPITLYVSITVVKALQAYFMERDLDMYDEENDVPMAARNMSLNEQLGQISHIFSDKTGTLTCNKMEFRKCSINGVSYGKGTTAIGMAARLRKDYVGDPNDVDDDEAEAETDDEFLKCPAPNVNFRDRRIWEDMKRGDDQAEKISEFFTHLALCHGVLIERMDAIPEGMTEPPIQYSASSPDEQALVCGAKYFGYEFINREPGSLVLKTPSGERVQYDVLEVFEFDSNRKRMSVVVQKRKTDRELLQMTGDDEDDILFLCKGADSVLFPRIAGSATNDAILSSTQTHLESFARDGLRTLVICSKKMKPSQWEQFHVRYRSACADLNQVEAKGRGEDNEIDRLQNEIEQDLELLGTTAIEDRLQDGVPETMESLAKAGICIWVLTGDMEETAINIGYACRLLNNDMERHVINAANYHSKGAILRELDKIFHSIHNKAGEGESTSYDVVSATNVEHALVIDGASLGLILEDPMYNLHLLRVSLLCKVVVACRVSPQQKAQLVELVKLNVPESHTLSIGDGANDVPMIQSAHIGIGISGQEGMQAVNSSDYALGQFRFLRPLILVHGRWNYNRVAMLVCYTFYKNIVYCLSMFWYCMGLSAYSGSMLYSAFIQQGYNLFFTALPIMVYAVFDRDVPKQVAVDFPVLYHAETRSRTMFTYQMFWKWIFLGVLDSIGVILVVLAAAWSINPHGETVSFTVLGSIGWTVLCMLVNARFCLMVNSWDILEVAGLLASVLVLYGFQWAIDQMYWPPPDYDTFSFPWLFCTANFWFAQMLAMVAILTKNFFYEACRSRFTPDYIDLVRATLNTNDKAAQEELRQCKPPATNYLSKDLAEMLDYRQRRENERIPVRFAAPGRKQLYRGFAFDQPAAVMNWILAAGSSITGTRKSMAVNPKVRQAILNSDDPVIFENERYQPFSGFGSGYPGFLLPTDRCRWSDRSGKVSAMSIPLAGLELNLDVPGCDEDGWVYEADFKLFPSDPPLRDSEGNDLEHPPGSKKKQRGHHGLVRRREWVLSEKLKTMPERANTHHFDSLSVIDVESLRDSESDVERLDRSESITII